MSGNMMVGMESVSLFGLVVILAGFLVIPHPKTAKSRWFLISLLCTAAGVISDIVAWYGEVREIDPGVQFISNLIALVDMSIIVSAFGYYITALIREKKPIGDALAHTVLTVNAAAVIFTVIEAYCGNVFVQEGLFYAEGPFYPVCNIVSSVSLAVLLAAALINFRWIGTRATVVVVIYCMLPLISVLIEVFVPQCILSYIAIVGSLHFIYTMLQSSRMDDLETRERVLQKMSYEDQLTGLKNRRSCEEDLEAIQPSSHVGIVFCNLNGLKRANTEFGYSSGDQMLISFAELLKKRLPAERIYRMNGDEFVGVVTDVTEEEFRDTEEAIRGDIRERADIAAAGFAWGQGIETQELMHTAEQRMYEDKAEFYRPLRKTENAGTIPQTE